MAQYANNGGDSGVVSYESGPGWIEVTFSDGSVYRYTDQSAGADNIAQMHALAISGQGLNGFINTNVKYRYASKVR